MSSLDLSALHSAIQSLDDGLSVVSDAAWFNQQNDKFRQTLIAGVIQNFEFVYEISVKMIRRQLELEADSPVDIDQTSFRDLLRIAGEKGLIADVEAWFGFRQMRDVTAHTYDHAKAQQVYQGTQEFLNQSRQLWVHLDGRHA